MQYALTIVKRKDSAKKGICVLSFDNIQTLTENLAIEYSSYRILEYSDDIQYIKSVAWDISNAFNMASDI